jgi:hypothetical protein
MGLDVKSYLMQIFKFGFRRTIYEPMANQIVENLKIKVKNFRITLVKLHTKQPPTLHRLFSLEEGNLSLEIL